MFIMNYLYCFNVHNMTKSKNALMISPKGQSTLYTSSGTCIFFIKQCTVLDLKAYSTLAEMM